MFSLKKLSLIAMVPVVMGTVLTSCGDDTVDPGEATVYYGAEQTVGGGKAKTFINVDENGVPTEIGIRLTAEAMDNLPDTGLGTMWNLALPDSGTASLPFKFVGMGWNPNGHEPPTIFDVPHFDFHFYTITEAQVMAIMPTDINYATKRVNFPDSNYLPSGYITDSSAVPMMGVHWLNPMDPDFAPGAFKEIMIYGTWDGKMTFIEPMVTRAYLMTKPTFSENLPTVARYQTTGYWPKTYNIKYDSDAKEYVISLGGLTMQTAS